MTDSDYTDGKSVLDLLDDACRADPKAIAFYSSGSQLTFAGWQESASAFASRFADLGLLPGSQIGLCYPASAWIDFASAFMGVLMNGSVALLIPSDLPEDAVTYLAGELELDAICTPNSLRLTRDDQGPLSVMNSNVDSPIRPAVILLTSGTTNQRKVVEVSHENLAWGKRDSGSGQGEVHLYQPVPGTQLGLVALVRPLLHGRPQCIIVDKPDASEIIALCASFGVTELTVVPHVAQRMSTNPDLERADGLKYIVLTGDHTDPKTVALLASRLSNAAVSTCYTTTECSPAAVYGTFDPSSPRAVGKPEFPTEVQIRDADADGIGSIYMRYAGAPARELRSRSGPVSTAASDGWIPTGDFGSIDADGRLVLFDREADVANVGGRLVGTIEIAQKLLTHPTITDAVAYAAPTASGRNSLIAAVVVTSATPVENVRVHLQRSLPDYMVPDRILIVDEIPRTASGKPLKRHLRDQPHPMTADEATLAVLWMEALQVLDLPDQIDDFLSLGGDSLAYAHLRELIAERMSIDVEPFVLLQAENLAEMAAQLTALRNVAVSRNV